MPRPSLHFMPLFSLLTAVLPTHAQNAVDIRMIALTGEQAPGVEAGVVYNEFVSFPEVLRLNNAGQVGFIATMVGPGIDSTNNDAIFAPGDDSDLTAVIHESEQAPDMPNGILLGQMVYRVPFKLNDAGQIAAYWGITKNKNSILAPATDSNLTAIVIEDAPVTAIGTDVFYNSFGSVFLNLNNGGQTTIVTTLSGPGVQGQYNSAIMSNVNGRDMEPIALAGQQAAELPDGVLYQYVTDPLLNDNGQVAYFAGLTGDGVSNSNDDAFYKYNNRTGSDHFLLAREDDQVPGYAPGVTFWSLSRSSLRINNSGQVLFSTAIRGDGITLTNNRAIFMAKYGSDLVTVVRNGDEAPGLGEEFRLDGFELNSMQLNNNGNVAVQAKISGIDVIGTNDRAIFGPRGSSNFTAIAREFDQAPGFPEGAVFTTFYSFLLSDSNQIAFYSQLYGEGVDGTNNKGLFATDIAGNVLLVAATGDVINVSRDPQVDDLRTIISLADYDLNSDFGDYALNNAGEIAFRAVFTDGSSGIFIATIPSPSCPADTNGDGELTPTDFTAWINAFNNDLPECDQNGDGSCTPTDFTAWVGNFNAGCN